MPYVNRVNGAIVGLALALQDGWDEEWLADDDAEVVAYRNPPVPDPQPIISMYAAAYNLGVSNGEITGIETAARLAAALYLDVGLYMVFPTEVQADTNYYPKVWDDAARMSVTEKGLDYFLVTSMDADGNPVDPSSFNIEIIRVSI